MVSSTLVQIENLILPSFTELESRNNLVTVLVDIELSSVPIRTGEKILNKLLLTFSVLKMYN